MIIEYLLGNLWAAATALMGVLAGYLFVRGKIETRQAEKKVRKQAEAVVERAEKDDAAKTKIDKEARDALDGDPNNDFINQ